VLFEVKTKCQRTTIESVVKCTVNITHWLFISLQEFYHHSVKMGRAEYREIAACIVNLFPSEEISAYHSLGNDKRHSCRGKLVDKYKNFLRRIRRIHVRNEWIKFCFQKQKLFLFDTYEFPKVDSRKVYVCFFFFCRTSARNANVCQRLNGFPWKSSVCNEFCKFWLCFILNFFCKDRISLFPELVWTFDRITGWRRCAGLLYTQ
jgi:hypothetical protein